LAVPGSLLTPHHEPGDQEVLTLNILNNVFTTGYKKVYKTLYNKPS
jgi:hypothetical protein